MKKILAIHTGGTISMVQEKDGSVSLSEINPLLEVENFFPSHIEIVSENIFNLPSPHITLKEMLLLKNRVTKAYEEGYYGVVITHGTDTLEETAYFLDITLEKNIAVVLTGAMRSSNELGSDGLYNFRNAVLAAASPKTKEQGVVVVMNDEIHSARFVTKTHTTNVDTFRTPTFGPVGIITKNKAYYITEAVAQETLPINTVDGEVFLVKSYAGMDGSIFSLLNNEDTKGVIIEALGAGNLPPACIKSLQGLLGNNIFVALVSRCSNGVAQDIYDYEGGGVNLKKMGVAFVSGINGPKARIRLIVGLNSGLKGKKMLEFMEK